MKYVPKRELDSVRLASGFKVKRKGVKFSSCQHSLDSNVPTAKTPSGKHLGKCSKCKGGFCIEDEKRRQEESDRINKTDKTKSLDDCLYEIRVEQRKRSFYGNYRKNRSFQRSHHRNDD